MEVRIYEIERKSFSNTKKVLELEDTCKIETKCESCNSIETKTIKAIDLKDFEKRNPCKCGGTIKIVSKEFFINKFARNGYILRDGKSLEIKKDFNYLYIKADENFFKENEKLILIEGVKRIHGSDFEKVKNEIEKEQESAAEGFGSIFKM